MHGARPAIHSPRRRLLGLDLLLAEALLLEAAGHGFAGRARDGVAIADAPGSDGPRSRPRGQRLGPPWRLRPAPRGPCWRCRRLRPRDLHSAPGAARLPPALLANWALLKHRARRRRRRGRRRRGARRRLGRCSSRQRADPGDPRVRRRGRRRQPRQPRAGRIAVRRTRGRSRPPGFAAQRLLAERLVAECALADGWGEPGAVAHRGREFFQRPDHPHVARACRSLLRAAGARLPRRPRAPSRATPAARTRRPRRHRARSRRARPGT